MNVIELWSENGSPTSKLFIRSLFVISTRSNMLFSRVGSSTICLRNCLELYQAEGNDAQMILKDGS